MKKYFILIACLLPFLQINCNKEHIEQKTFTINKRLSIGSDAPTLSCTTWIKGIPEVVKSTNKIYVIEFWATWCGPCLASILHLSELQDKYKDSIIIIGIASWEQQKNYNEDDRLPKLEKFVNGWGDKIRYGIVYDDGNSKTNEEWLQAAGLGGIPTAFIIGIDNKIKWIGNPGIPEFDIELEKAITAISPSVMSTNK